MMRILITGGGGQLGRALRHLLKGTEFFAPDSRELDVTDQRQALRVIGAYRPQAVIHGAAYTNVDRAEAEPERAYKVNAAGAQNVAAACLECNAKMVYVSTDYVFDGALGRPYHEFDRAAPRSVYGKSKLAGEMLAGRILNRLFIVRTSWLYGQGNNFVRTMLRLGRERNEIKVVDDQFGCPTNAADLAEVILRLMETSHYGVFHVTNTGITSWYGFADKIVALAGYDGVKVLPQSTAELNRPAARPPYSPLDHLMLRLTIGDTTRPWQEALAEYIGRETDRGKV